MSYADTSVAVELSSRARRRRLIRKRFLRRPFAVIGLAIALTFIIVAIFAPWIAPYHPETMDLNAILAHPSSKHLLGTDELGRDVFSRLVWGARASIFAGVFATLLATVIAVPIGLVAGYYRGWIDPVIARLTDVLLAFPFLIIAVGLAAILGPSLRNATIALCLGAIPGLIRVARGETLSLREEDYVRAAVANGASDVRILGKHIFPNMLPTVIVQMTVTIPAAIIGEAVLSFLGLGVQSPQTSWGVMLSDAKDYLTTAPRLSVYPGLAIFFCSLSFNLFGDGLRDVLDPRTTR
ncbi:MAG TPA: ABC transporter permease [Caldimonas sp.]|nr:ABC transporter permease [Caldimonas sp.]